MAVTQQNYTGNGSTTNYSFTFPYLAETDVGVKINGTTQATTTYSFANATTISMNTAPANGAAIIIFRNTNNDAKKATFYPGSAIKAEDLNNDFDQILYTAQEVDNNSMSTLGDDPMQGDLSLGNNKLTNVGTPTANTDGTNKTYVDSTIDTKIDTAMANDVLAGTDIAKTASGGQVTINHNVSGANTTVNNSDGNVIQDITITAQGHVTAVGSKNLNDVYYTEAELDAGQLDNRYYTETEADARYYRQDQLDGGSLDNRYYTETEADARFYRLASTEEIQSGETWVAADNKVATTSAIDARIVDLVDDVGGFVPIANETSFPLTNPDINNQAGTLVSVPLASSRMSDGGGVIQIGNATSDNSTVRIENCTNNTVYAAGFGLIVETTSTLHTYRLHRHVPKATEVTTVAGNISNITTVGGISGNVTTVAGIASNITTVAGVASNVTTVAGIASNVTAVAGDAADIGAVAGKATEIGRLGTADAVADLAILGTTAIVEDLNLLGTTAAVADMALLGDSAVIADMAIIADTSNLITNIGTVAGVQANVTTVAGISSNVTAVASDATDIGTVAGAIANVNTVAGIASNVTTVAGDTTAINNITTNLSAVQGAATNATNAASSATSAATSKLDALFSKTTAASSATSAATSATNAATSATSSASSASTSTSQASTATTQASNASTSAANALAYKNLALQYRDTTSGILTQTKSIAYNLVDSASSHTAWGSITDGDTADFADESSNTFLTMAEGSATYNYGSIT